MYGHIWQVLSRYYVQVQSERHFSRHSSVWQVSDSWINNVFSSTAFWTASSSESALEWAKFTLVIFFSRSLFSYFYSIAFKPWWLLISHASLYYLSRVHMMWEMTTKNIRTETVTRRQQKIEVGKQPTWHVQWVFLLLYFHKILIKQSYHDATKWKRRKIRTKAVTK